MAYKISARASFDSLSIIGIISLSMLAPIGY
jgi:hypothetical protein